MTTYAYDTGVERGATTPHGGQLTLTRPDGSQIRFDYDSAHRLTAIGDSAGNRVEFTLDALGRLQAAIDTRNVIEYTTTHGYDPNGNPLRTYIWRDNVPVSLIVHGTPEVALYLETDHLNGRVKVGGIERGDSCPRSWCNLASLFNPLGHVIK